MNSSQKQTGNRILRGLKSTLSVVAVALCLTGTAASQGIPSWSVQYFGDIVPRGKDYHIVDLFDVKDSEIAALKASGSSPIAYISSQYENWRPDVGSFPAGDIGNPLGTWAGERWINPYSTAIRNLMLTRLDLAAARGFVGVDFDNVDFYLATTGFDNSTTAAINYIRFLADAAHARGLLFGLKNATELIIHVSDVIDYYVNEEAHQYGEQGAYKNLGKPVFNIEYLWLKEGSPWMYTIYKEGAIMDSREVVIADMREGAVSNTVEGTNSNDTVEGTNSNDNAEGDWEQLNYYHSYANSAYAYYYALGYPADAAAVYYYYIAMGYNTWYSTAALDADALFQYYYGTALYHLYGQIESGNPSLANYYYNTNLAFASYYYWLLQGDASLANETYQAYMALAYAD